jgi:hypothetical protein
MIDFTAIIRPVSGGEREEREALASWPDESGTRVLRE